MNEFVTVSKSRSVTAHEIGNSIGYEAILVYVLYHINRFSIL